MTPWLPRDAHALLTRTAAAGVTGGRAIALPDPATGYGLLVRQVSATVLARRITFEFDTGDRLSCDATNRQLVRVSTGDGTTIALSDGDDDAAQTLCAVLADIFGRAHKASVHAQANGVAQGQSGLSAALLSELLDIASTGTEAPPREVIETLLDGFGNGVLCALRLAPGPAAPIRGSAEDLRTLAQMAGALFGKEGGRKELLGPRALMVLDQDLPDGRQFVLATHDGVTAAALTQAGAGARLARTYAALTG